MARNRMAKLVQSYEADHQEKINKFWQRFLY
jgi:hypothetical protein